MNVPKLSRPLVASGLLVAGLLAAWSGLGNDASTCNSSSSSQRQDLDVVYSDPDGSGFRPNGVARVRGELILDFQDEARPDQISDLFRRHGIKGRLNSLHSAQPQLWLSSVDEDQMPHLLEALGKEDILENVSPNYVYTLPEGEQMAARAWAAAPSDESFPNDPMGKYQWHMDQIHVKEAWPISTGASTVVAVIDTGVGYRDFKDFRKLEDLENTRFVPGYDFVHDRVEAIDDHAHGSHVAGTIAQSTNNGKGVMGVAFDSAIMPIKVLSARGSGTLGDIADGIYFSANHGARIINMSLGGPFAESTLATAVRKVHSKGVIVVCAAGNSGGSKPGYPAGYAQSVSVAAVDFNENLTFYSNRGANDISAPGGDTRSDRNGDGMPDGVLQQAPKPGSPQVHEYQWFMGTSMACPHVAGVAALVQSLGVTHPDAVERLLESTARSKGPEGVEEGYGAGIVDAQRATWKAGIEFGAWRLGLGLVLFALPALAMLRRGDFLGLALAKPAAVFAASGFFFWPLLVGSNTPACWMVTTALPSWGLHLLGVQHHGNPLFFSALIPVLLSLLVVDFRLLRSILAGLTAGWAAHLVFAAVTGSVSVMFIPGLLGSLWLLANGLFLVFLATILGEEQP